MKNRSIAFTILAFILASTTLNAQNDLTIPLSNPDQPGKLIINTVFADEIVIKAHATKEVFISYNGEENDEEDLVRSDGMRKISSGGVGIEVTEDNNEVVIRTGPMPNDLELEVLVPKNFSIKLNTTQGDIEIDGLSGEFEINAVNGDVDLKNISGSVVLNSVNGDIGIDFIQIDPDAPMSFTGVNGDIEVAFPADAKFNAKMKTEWGDIFTNFDMQVTPVTNASETNMEDGKYRIAINKWVNGTVNGGGTEYLFKTLRGDISIRKKD